MAISGGKKKKKDRGPSLLPQRRERKRTRHREPRPTREERQCVFLKTPEGVDKEEGELFNLDGEWQRERTFLHRKKLHGKKRGKCKRSSQGGDRVVGIS